MGRFARLHGWLAGLLLWVGCGGGGGTVSSPPTPQPPTIQLQVQPDATNFDKVTLTWTYSSAAVADGFRLEFQVDGSGFQPMLTDLIPQAVEGLYITFDPATPECHTFSFRLSAMRGANVLAHAEADYRRSLRPVWSASLTPRSEREAIVVTWEKNPHSIATGYVVERNDGISGWVAVTSPVESGQSPTLGCWDLGRQEGQPYTYRIIPTLGSERGMPTRVSVQMPTWAPDHLVATPSGPGFQLSWSNRSTSAYEVRVYRATLPSLGGFWSDPVLVATLPVPASGYLDAAPPVAARLAYQVVAAQPNWPATPSEWCLAGGVTTLDGLGLARTPLILPFAPLARGGDGGWLGLVSWWDSPTCAMRLERVPAVTGFATDIPLTYGSLNYPTQAVSSQLWPDGTFDLQVTEQVGSMGALNSQVLRWTGGAWTRHAFHSDQGLALGGGGFARDGVLQAFTYNASFEQGQFRMEPTGAVTQGLVPDLPRGAKWGPYAAPAGGWIALTQDSAGWYLGTRAPDGTWSFRLLAALDIATHGFMDCRDVQVDSTGALYALFANSLAEGFEVNLLRVPPGGAAEEVQTVISGVTTGFAWGRVGALAFTPDGTRLGFAIMDDRGELRLGIRTGSGAWSLRTGLVPDARADWKTPFLRCGFSPEGRFWVLHDEVAHPTGASQERYFELLEDTQP